jgi:methylthioribose-1-phosphate isomerase
MVAVLAAEHGLPFYVAAPLSTVDFSTDSGEGIPIEQRPAREVSHVGEIQLTPEGVAIANPAFDVTPEKFVTAIITDKGVARPPYNDSLAKLRDQLN